MRTKKPLFMMRAQALLFLIAVLLVTGTMGVFAQRDPYNPDNYFYDEGCWGTINIEVGETKTVSCTSHMSNLSRLTSIIWTEHLSAGYIKVVSGEKQTTCTIEGTSSGTGKKLWCLLEYGTQSYPFNTYKAYYLVNVTSKGKLKLSASSAGGKVAKGTKVYLTADQPDADIYYAIDDIATTSSPKYTSAGITIDKACTLSAFAKKRGYDSSDQISLSFTIEKGIDIDATNFPDENFRKWLLGRSYGKDGVLTESEIRGITTIWVSNENISSLKGIEHFTALTNLWCYDNQLTALDVSKNTALTNVDCSSNKLTALDLSNNIALTDLSCVNNQLTALDVSKNTVLTDLWCYDNQLTALDVSKNTALTTLICYDNQLTALDVSKNTVLTELYCGGNQLTVLDVSKNTALKELSCYGNQLMALDVSKNTALTHLICYDTQLMALDVSKNTALTVLNCHDTQLTALDVSKNTALTTLYCYNNNIKGASMDALISSLPQNNTTEEHDLRIYNSTSSNEGCIYTTSQVVAIKAKGWTLQYYNGTKWVEYEGSGVPEPETITLPATETVNINQTITLTPTIEPADAVTTLTWSSDDETIATVSSEGVVKGLKKGLTIISVETENGKTAYCKLTVTAPEPTAVTLPKSATVYVGGTLTLTPTLEPEGAETALTWTSDDETIATVSSDGVVKGLKKGQTFINVETENGKTAYCKLTVTAAEPTAVTLPKSATVYVGGTLTLTPTIEPEGAETTLTWKSDDESVVRVDANGVLTGVAEGLALVTVTTANGLTSDACKVKVELDPTGIKEVKTDGRTNVPVYTVSGQKVTGSLKGKKGVYIVGGKKVVVK